MAKRSCRFTLVSPFRFLLDFCHDNCTYWILTRFQNLVEEMEIDRSKFMNALPLNAAALFASSCGTVWQLVESKHMRLSLSSDNQVNAITLFITLFEVSR